METIKTWQERARESLHPSVAPNLTDDELSIVGTKHMLLYIADLEAALAKQAEATPVGVVDSKTALNDPWVSAVRSADNMCPFELSTPDKWRWKAAHMQAALAQRAASVEAKPVAGWGPIEILYGPRTHICWTPDLTPPDKREQVVLIRYADYLRMQPKEDTTDDWDREQQEYYNDQAPAAPPAPHVEAKLVDKEKLEIGRVYLARPANCPDSPDWFSDWQPARFVGYKDGKRLWNWLDVQASDWPDIGILPLHGDVVLNRNDDPEFNAPFDVPEAEAAPHVERSGHVAAITWNAALDAAQHGLRARVDSNEMFVQTAIEAIEELKKTAADGVLHVERDAALRVSSFAELFSMPPEQHAGKRVVVAPHSAQPSLEQGDALRRLTSMVGELLEPASKGSNNFPTDWAISGLEKMLAEREQGDALSQQATACLQDVISHYSDFLAACHYRREACLKDGDADNAAYWAHQSSVLARMKQQAEAALAQRAASQRMSADQFEEEYASRSNTTVEELRKRHRVVPCNCDDEQCQGWQMFDFVSAAERAKWEACQPDSERDAALHLIGWREWDDRWIFYDVQEDPELCAHIAEHQKETHGVSVWPVYCAAMAAQQGKKGGAA